MSKKDYSYNNNQYKSLHGGVYQVLDNRYRYTAYSDKSSRENGKLMLKENVIDRMWYREVGIPPMAVYNGPNGSTLAMSLHEGNIVEVDEYRLTVQATNSALDRFYTRLEERIILGMEYIVERKSLFDYLARGARLLYDIYLACRKRSFKTLRKYDPRRKKITVHRVEMSFHEKWLEYHFAIAPVMSDIYNVCMQQGPQHGSKIRVRATASETQTDSGKDWAGAWYTSNTVTVRKTLTGYASVTDPVLASGNYIGLDPTKFLWDILPFSFVVDWFFNVGQWIDTISTPGWTVVNTSVTTLTKRKSVTHAYCIMTTNNGYYSTLGSGVTREITSYKREPGPLPSVTLAWQGGIDSTWRAITSLALLRSIFGGK